MPDQLPAEPAGFLNNLRVMVANLAIERGAGAYAMAGQNFHDPPDANAVAIVAHRPVAHVRDVGAVTRYPLVLISRHHVVQSKEFDVGIDPQRDPRVVRPSQLRAASDRDIGERTITTRYHR